MPQRFASQIELFGTSRLVMDTQNPAVQAQMTRAALKLLADLLDFPAVGAGAPTLSDFIDSGRAYDPQHDAELRTLVRGKLAHFELWTSSAASQTRAHALPRQAALQTVAALRAAGFE